MHHHGIDRGAGSAAGSQLLVTQVLEVQHKARQIAVDGYSCERKFYSTAPLFLLENEIKYPPELAAGPFLMFFLRGEELAKKGEAYDLDAHIKAWNPDIVMWGYLIGSHEAAEDAVDRYHSRLCRQATLSS